MPRKIVVTIPALSDQLRSMIDDTANETGFEVMFFNGNKDAESAVHDAEIILGNAPELACKAPQLKWFCTPSAGVNQYAAPGTFANDDVILTNSTGAYGVTIAEHVVMLLLEILRRQSEYNGIVARREWIKNLHVRSVYGSRITFLGTGDIGTECALRLKAFSPASITGVNRSGRVRNEVYDRTLTFDHLNEILKETDILIASLPGTAQTDKMLNRETLALLPDNAVIINVGRGTVIDQAAIVNELNSGRLYAGLDVFEKEPVPADDPIWDCPNLLMTPHAAGNLTLDHTVERVVEMFIENLRAYAAGVPMKRVIDMKKGY